MEKIFKQENLEKMMRTWARSHVFYFYLIFACIFLKRNVYYVHMYDEAKKAWYIYVFIYFVPSYLSSTVQCTFIIFFLFQRFVFALDGFRLNWIGLDFALANLKRKSNDTLILAHITHFIDIFVRLETRMHARK